MDLQTRLKASLKYKHRKLGDVLLPIHFTKSKDNPEYEKHYNRHIDLSHLDRVEEEPEFPFEDLLKCDCKHLDNRKTVVTFGACGVGKTTAVQRCALDWAEGRAHQHVELLFTFECWELQLLVYEKLSLIQLIQIFYPDLKELDANSLSSKKVWFVFDELEDLDDVLSFSGKSVCEVNEVAPVFTLLPNLIKGFLLPSVHIWITTRYGGAGTMWKGYKIRELEMRGYSDEQKDLHIRKLVGDDELANRIIAHIQISNSLYHLSRIPYMCTVIATVLKNHVKKDDYKIRPMTLTEIYSSLTKNLQSEFIPRVRNNALFGRKDLSRYFCWIKEDDILANSSITVREMSSFAQEHPLVFKEKKSVRGVTMFRYGHISVLEFFVVLTTFDEITADKNQFYNLLHEAYRQYEGGQFDICLRFFFGLIKERRTLEPQDEFFEIVKKIILSDNEGDFRVTMFHCLREFDSHAFKYDLVSYFNPHSAPFSEMSVIRGMKLAVMVGNVDGKVHQFQMALSSRCDEKLLRSLALVQKAKQAMLRFSNLSERCCPALASVLGTRESVLRDLDLAFNSITDSGVQSLVQGLKAQDCRLKSLRLQACELTSSACEHLAAALKLSPNLIELDLSSNDIGDVGLQHLAKGLQSRKCQLQTLKLSQCNLTKEGGLHLASALGKNSSYLKWLDLSINNIGNQAANALFVRFDISKLKKLEMYCCGLTEDCCEKIAKALKLEKGTLVDLNLSSNNLKNGGAHWITDGLFAYSKLEKLNLSRCAITAKGCFYLSKVLTCVTVLYTKNGAKGKNWQATELRELNLSMNRFGDKGAINLADGFKNPYSHLQKLDLSECDLTSECCSDMAAQLADKDCSITELKLCSNRLEDRGAKRLCVALKSPDCSLEKLFLRNCGLTSECVPFLIAALKSNRHLRELHLMGNTLEHSAIAALVRTAKSDGYNLKRVDVSVD